MPCAAGGEPFDFEDFFEPELAVREKTPLPSAPRLPVLLRRPKSSALNIFGDIAGLAEEAPSDWDLPKLEVFPKGGLLLELEPALDDRMKPSLLLVLCSNEELEPSRLLLRGGAVAPLLLPTGASLSVLSPFCVWSEWGPGL